MTTKRSLRRGIAACIVAICLGAGLVSGCRDLPSLDDRPSSTALVDTGPTRLARAISPRVAAHPGKSGIYPLSDGREAFAARVLLARAAERSLDVQYYIWRKDMSGTLLLAALREAADRGVRVRLLLDDNTTAGLDPALTALDAHPNIEVRLFNPFVIRAPRWIGYLTDFARLNRRMHNKSFTADNQATIVGGRNVGDEYFDASEGVSFLDLDVLAVGPVVGVVSADFDRYWASGSSYPVDRLLPPPSAAQIEEFVAAVTRTQGDRAAAEFLKAVRQSPFVHDLIEGRLVLDWAVTRMVSDPPAKGLGLAEPEELLPRKLRGLLGDPAAELDLVSAYFVPTAAGVDTFIDLAVRGVRIRVLTNALEATDVAIVHAGYAKWRKALLAGGVTLYEIRRQPSRGVGKRAASVVGGSGSSASSLHAKTFSVDGARVFIGSFNFDPRSARLNTESGVVIESPTLAGRIRTAFRDSVPADAYEVRLSQTGDLYWLDRRDGESARHDTEPGTTAWQRHAVRILSLLPIEWLL